MKLKNLAEKIRAFNLDPCKEGTCGHLFQYEHCTGHGTDEWCQDCIADPPLQEVVLEDGTVTHGFILTNHT